MTPAIPAGAATTSAPESFGSHGRSQPGAAAAWTEELYARHGRLVSGLCRALLRDATEAEDAAQQTFLSAHRSLLNGAVPQEPAAWLATIARNECWARIRSGMRRPLPTAEVDSEISTSDPLAEAIRRADLAAMWAAIAELPRQQRDALLLREFGGLSYEELAGALAVTGPAVESLLFRARQGIRVRLGAAYAGLTGGSWLDALARLGGGIGGGMAPVAAKVAAVGVGAAVATGGAVVAPGMLEHRQHRHSPPARHAVTKRAAQPPVASARTPIAVAQVASRHTVALVRPSSGDDNRRSSHDDHESSGDRSSTGGQGSDSGNERTTASERTRDHETDATPPTRSDTKSHDGSSSNDGREVDTAEAADATPPPQGNDPPPPERNAGVATATPNPAVTVTLAGGDPPPLAAGTVPRSDD